MVTRRKKGVRNLFYFDFDVPFLHGASIAGIFLLLGGCGKPGPKLPETFPVTGEVRYPDGKPVAQGVIQFHLVSDPALNVSAPIADGKFALVTAFASATRAGAIPGRYRVRVTPMFNPVPRTIKLSDLYEILPQPNAIVIQIEADASGGASLSSPVPDSREITTARQRLTDKRLSGAFDDLISAFRSCTAPLAEIGWRTTDGGNTVFVRVHPSEARVHFPVIPAKAGI